MATPHKKGLTSMGFRSKVVEFCRLHNLIISINLCDEITIRTEDYYAKFVAIAKDEWHGQYHPKHGKKICLACGLELEGDKPCPCHYDTSRPLTYMSSYLEEQIGLLLMARMFDKSGQPDSNRMFGRMSEATLKTIVRPTSRKG